MECIHLALVAFDLDPFAVLTDGYIIHKLLKVGSTSLKLNEVNQSHKQDS